MRPIATEPVMNVSKIHGVSAHGNLLNITFNVVDFGLGVYRTYKRRMPLSLCVWVGGRRGSYSLQNTFTVQESPPVCGTCKASSGHFGVVELHPKQLSD